MFPNCFISLEIPIIKITQSAICSMRMCYKHHLRIHHEFIAKECGWEVRQDKHQVVLSSRKQQLKLKDLIGSEPDVPNHKMKGSLAKDMAASKR